MRNETKITNGKFMLCNLFIFLNIEQQTTPGDQFLENVVEKIFGKLYEIIIIIQKQVMIIFQYKIFDYSIYFFIEIIE